MAKNVLGRNYTFPIYNQDGTSFFGLALRKSTFESVVMSLGDKITGEVYYKDNTLPITMQEYIEYKENPSDENEQAVKYFLLNPPTITKEGLVRDNSELSGMTKYSFVFYHPMCLLANLPFSDVATSINQERYLSENKEFSWIGTPSDYIKKINWNLEGTQWVVVKSERFPQEKDNELSEVLQFNNETIADALKKGYDTWGVPFVVDAIKEGEYTYIDEHNQEIDYYSVEGGSKRFVIVVGLPSNEIYASSLDRQMDNPFVFHYGKGVGLKNNSRTPRNNKIITRISGYGSENNVPFGYPQIVWTGNQDWDYTTNNDASNPLSYPIYKGIVGGQYVKLIKHPFTRKHLMPSVYTDCVNKKVNPFADDYDPTIELVDYYDAIGGDYPNNINPLSPSYESHEFDVKPELDSEREIGLVSAIPLNADLTPASAWDDTMDDDGNFLQSYFQITLPQLTFDIYACAAITEEMQINMRSGDCMGCTFNIQVDWEDYKRNFYDQDGNFVPNGTQRDLVKYPKSNEGQISVIAQKDNNTFGILLPNTYQHPNSGDNFVILGISLPIEYIHNAELRLDEMMQSYMLENNVYYYDYPLKFDEHFLATRTNILSQIKTNTIIRFDFAGNVLQLYVKQLSIKYGYGLLPQYDITLTDNIEVVLNQIGQVADDVERLGSLLSILRQDYSRNVWLELSKKLSKTDDDVARGIITFLRGIAFGASQKWSIDGDGRAILNTINAQEAIFKKLTAQEAHFFTLIIDEIKSVGGQLIITPANCRIDYIKDIGTGWKCYFKAKEGERTIDNQWDVSDQAIHVEFNVSEGGSKNYWRLVTGKSSNPVKMDITTGVEYGDSEEGEDIYSFHWIVLSKNDCKSNSTIPMVGDEVSQLGNRDSEKTDRQNAIILSAYNIPFIYTGPYEGDANGILAPLYASFYNINDFKITEENLMVGIARNGHVFKGRVVIKEGSTLADGREINDLGITEGNLVRNSGFTGNFDSEEVKENDEVSADTIIFSDPLKFWESKNVEVDSVETTTSTNVDYKAILGKSVSGSVAIINNGPLKQQIESGISVDTWYVLSFKACCPDTTTETTLNVALGGVTNAVKVYNSVQRVDLPFKSAHDSSVSEYGTLAFMSTSKVMLMDVMLIRGNIPSEYQKSEKDNDKSLANFLGLSYLQHAITEASTEIIGGLVLTQLIKVGMYRDKQFTQETGGMSGLYIDEHSPFIYGGGTLEQAIYTAMKYSNPRYMPDDAEVAEMAKFVVTHGGRAILNDICLRGYIYALGGIFKNVQSQDGKWSLDEHGVMKCIEAWISGSIYTPYLIINDSNISQNSHPSETSGWEVTPFVIDLDKTGLNLQMDCDATGNVLPLIELPTISKYVGGEANIYVNKPCVIVNVTTIRPSRNYQLCRVTLDKGQKIKLKCIDDNGTYRWIPDSYSDLMRFRQALQIAFVYVHVDRNASPMFVEQKKSYDSNGSFTYVAEPNSEGRFWVTLPTDWQNLTFASDLIVVAHSYGVNGVHVNASIITFDDANHKFLVGVGDDASPNDGDFGFSIYLTNRTVTEVITT